MINLQRVLLFLDRFTFLLNEFEIRHSFQPDSQLCQDLVNINKDY